MQLVSDEPDGVVTRFIPEGVVEGSGLLGIVLLGLVKRRWRILILRLGVFWGRESRTGSGSPYLDPPNCFLVVFWLRALVCCPVASQLYDLDVVEMRGFGVLESGPD